MNVGSYGTDPPERPGRGRTHSVSACTSVPTSSSWLNLIERSFGISLARGSAEAASRASGRELPTHCRVLAERSSVPSVTAQVLRPPASGEASRRRPERAFNIVRWASLLTRRHPHRVPQPGGRPPRWSRSTRRRPRFQASDSDPGIPVAQALAACTSRYYNPALACWLAPPWGRIAPSSNQGGVVQEPSV